jgi:hypothetical protein
MMTGWRFIGIIGLAGLASNYDNRKGFYNGWTTGNRL